MDAFIELLCKVSPIVLLVIFSCTIIKKSREAWKEQILQGIIFGLIAILGMLNPLICGQGIIFDGRSIMISISGLYWGPLAAAISASMTAALRIYQGGNGALTGVLVILASAIIGVVFHLKYKQKLKDLIVDAKAVLAMGFIVHIIMLLLMFTLPENLALPTLKKITFPVIFIYPLATLLIGMIISKTIHKEQARQHQEESDYKIRAITNSTQDAIILFDQNYNITFWNQAAERIFQYSKEEAIQKQIDFIFAPTADYNANLSELKEHLKLSVDAQAEKFLDIKAIRKDSKEIITQLSTSTVTLNSQTFTIGIIRDITIAKVKEKEQQEIKKQIIHTSKLAAIGTLAAGIAHEINNPLAIIKGLVNVIQNELANINKGQELLLLLEKHQNAVSRIDNIVTGLRSFARADTEDIEQINLKQLLINTLLLCENIFEKNGITINKHFSDKDIVIRANTGKLQQVLMNLLSNAKDACDERGTNGIISIESYVEGTKAVIKITDNGTGISPKIADRIFDPFFTTKPSGKGTGLGLHISHAIITAFDGQLTVSSKEGHGSSFFISLPLSNYPISINTSATASSGSETPDKFSGSALIVDDEDDLRFILSRYIGEMGLTTTQAANGMEALELLKKQTFDYVFTDIIMPKMNGDVLLQNAKNISHLQNTKFIVITGGVLSHYTKAQQDNINKYADEILKKPFEEPVITRILKSFSKKNT